MLHISQLRLKMTQNYMQEKVRFTPPSLFNTKVCKISLFLSSFLTLFLSLPSSVLSLLLQPIGKWHLKVKTLSTSDSNRKWPKLGSIWPTSNPGGEEGQTTQTDPRCLFNLHQRADRGYAFVTQAQVQIVKYFWHGVLIRPTTTYSFSETSVILVKIRN